MLGGGLMSLVFWQHRTVSQDVATQAKVDTNPLAQICAEKWRQENRSKSLKDDNKTRTKTRITALIFQFDMLMPIF